MTKQRSETKSWGRFARILGAVALATALSGCVVDAGPGHPGGGWCWWHPGRCAR